MLREIESQHARKHFCATSFTTDHKEGGVLIHCPICNMAIKAGPLKHKLQPFKTHLETRNHMMNIAEKSHIDPSQTIFDMINKHHKNQFRKKENAVQCKDCHIEINLLAKAGDPIARVASHLQSNKHKEAAKKLNNVQSITAFLTTQPPRPAQAE